MRELLEQGGWVLAVIFGLSVVGWALIAWKWLELREQASGGFGWAREAVREARGGRREKAAAVCRSRGTLAGRLMLAALEAREPERRFFERHLGPVFESEATGLRKNLDLIAVLGGALPLLGLLGTVLGMAATFGALTRYGVADADRLAGGISQALVTTQAGLVVALPILLMHRYLSSRVERYIDTTALYIKKIETTLCHD